MSRDQYTLSTVWDRFPEALIEIKQNTKPLSYIGVTIRPAAGPTMTGAGITIHGALKAALGSTPKRRAAKADKVEAVGSVEVQPASVAGEATVTEPDEEYPAMAMPVEVAPVYPDDGGYRGWTDARPDREA